MPENLTPGEWQSIFQNPVRLRSLLRKRKYLGNGTYGCVYAVAGYAVKIGCVDQTERDIQAWVHEKYGRALPVIAYCDNLNIPLVVTREICPVHGYPGFSLGDGWGCHCGESMSALVMPLAEDGFPAWKSPFVRRMYEKIADAVEQEFGFSIDIRKWNLLKWNGKIVVCDFGDPQVDWW